MGDRLKGVHLLPQQDYEKALVENQIDDDVIYVTPEDFSALAREQVRRIDKNEADIAVNTNNINTLNNELQTVKTSVSDASNEIISVKNTITEIILRDTNQDNRLTNIEETFATKEYVVENGGKIDHISVNGIDQNIVNKRVSLTIPTTTNELTNDSGYITKDVDDLTNYSQTSSVGNKIRLNIDSSTYVMTVSLLNSSDGVLSTGTVDLPLETVVVGARYADGKLYLTLKDGTELEGIDISNIISGLVPDTRTINGKDLKQDISLSNTDVGAPSVSDLNATNTRVTTLETTVTELTPEVAKSLKTPMTAPTSIELVAVDTANGQAMILIGDGLVIENDTLKSTGGVQIVDNLTSTSISAALSANQGRVLNTAINTKANQSALDSTNANVTSNTNAIAGINDRLDNLDLTYATDEDVQNLQSQINTKAEQSALNSTNANVASNTNAIGTKANQSALDNLATTVSTKANQSALDSTNSQVSTNTSDIATLKTSKANQSDLNTTNTKVNTNTTNIATNASNIATLQTSKANQTALDELWESATNAVQTLDARVEQKAEKTMSNVNYITVRELLPDKKISIGAGTMDWVIEYWVAPDGSSWYRKWKSGWKECGGKKELPSSGSDQTITFPITFHTDYGVYVTMTKGSLGNSTALIGDIGASSVNKYGFKTRGYNGPARYYACGY